MPVLNWLWQGAVLGVLTMGALRLMARTPAQTRSVVCWAAVASVLALPLVPLVPFAIPSAWTPHATGGYASPLVALPSAWWTSLGLVLSAWGVWALANGLRVVGALLELQRARGRCHGFPSELEARLPCWTRLKAQGRRAHLALSEDVHAAAVLGGRRPVIAIAPEVVRHLAADELDRVVVHEWAHVQRRDDLANLLQLAIRAVAGWHPTLWWIDRRLSVEREIACDQVAVATTQSPRSYAACLVRLAELPLGPTNRLSALGVLSSLSLAARVRRIVSQTSLASPAWSRKAATASIAAVGLASLTIATFRIVDIVVGSSDLEAESLQQTMAPSSTPALSALSSATRDAGPGPAGRPTRQTPTATTRGLRASPLTALPGRIDLQTLTPAKPQAPLLPDPSAPETPSSGAARLPTASDPSSEQPGTRAVEPAPPAAPDGAAGQAPAPWSVAAEAGVALGQSSKKAGLATAGLFSRISKRLAGSF